MPFSSESLVERIYSTIRSMGIDCYRISRQTELKKLYPKAKRGEHLEIDLVCLIDEFCIFIEVTTQKDKNSKKIGKFLRNCDLFINSKIDLKEKFRIIGIPINRLDDFEEVKEWRFAYFGTSYELIDEEITPQNFPDVANKFAIFNNYEINYLISLTKLIKKFAKPEFLSNFKIPMERSNPIKRIKGEFVKIENKKLSPSLPKTNIYLLYFSPNELLNICRVFRYGGVLIPFETEVSEGSEGEKYQRILIENKINEIVKDFIKDNYKISFPTTVTLVLNSPVEFDSRNNILIPTEYGSMNIIDGQHRIFAYANKEISNNTREKAEIFATVIEFININYKKLNEFSAKLFFEINSKHTKVKRNLLYLVKYDVLKERDAVSIAGKTILEINKKGVFKRIFLTNPLMRENILKLTPIPIVTVIDELSKMVDIEAMSKKETLKKNFEKAFDKKIDYFKRDRQNLYEKCKEILNKFFFCLREIFSEDWKENTNSNLFYAKYIAAMIRLLKFSLIDEGKSLEIVKIRLRNIKTSVRQMCNASAGSETFHKDFRNIPTRKQSVNEIFEFLKSKY